MKNGDRVILKRELEASELGRGWIRDYRLPQGTEGVINNITRDGTVLVQFPEPFFNPHDDGIVAFLNTDLSILESTGA